ncbi:MAG: hypothetical protein M1813_009695 [Trichoglossum hirsutum]|nr:MAG: hypothetical protein M1813_009695 [Trichoglossum hirsutum]
MEVKRTSYENGRYIERTEDSHEADVDAVIQPGSKDMHDVYRDLDGLPGFQLYIGHFGEGENHHLVLQATGPTIEDLLENYSESSLSLKTVLILMDQLIERLRVLHSRGFFHGGIRPSNLAISYQDGSPIYLTGLGCPEKYRDDNQGSLYASISPDLSHRSDLESLGYVLLRFLRGGLPWENLLKGDDIIQKKRDLLQNLNDWPQLAEYLQHLHALESNEVPDYSSLRKLFAHQFEKAGFVDDNVYDWRKWRAKQQSLQDHKTRKVIIAEIKGRLSSEVGQNRIQCLKEMLHMYIPFPDELCTHVYTGFYRDDGYLEMISNEIQELGDNCIEPIRKASDVPLWVFWSAHATVCAYARAWPMFEERLGGLRESITKAAKERAAEYKIWVESEGQDQRVLISKTK